MWVAIEKKKENIDVSDVGVGFPNRILYLYVSVFCGCVECIS